jgi:regulator of ribonuclease activity A
MYFSTADLCDENQNKNIQVLSSEFKNYGGLVGFWGQIRTIKLNKSNWDLLSMLKDEDGTDKIVVVDVDKEFYGIVGDKLSLFAERNNYKAIVLNGYVRDIDETKNIDVGLFAIGTCPLRNFEKNKGERNIELKFGGVTFNSGDFLYADEDGIIICSEELNINNLKRRY